MIWYLILVWIIYNSVFFCNIIKINQFFFTFYYFNFAYFPNTYTRKISFYSIPCLKSLIIITTQGNLLSLLRLRTVLVTFAAQTSYNLFLSLTSTHYTSTKDFTQVSSKLKAFYGINVISPKLFYSP